MGVETLNGVTRANLNAINPAIVHYIGHVHVALAGFIAATGIAVAALSWYGVRRGGMVGVDRRRSFTSGRARGGSARLITTWDTSNLIGKIFYSQKTLRLPCLSWALYWPCAL